MSLQEDQFFGICPPTLSTVDAKHQVLSVVTGAAAANYDWVTALGTSAPEGSVMLLLEASTTDCWVRFKPTTAAAATTVTNGLLVKAGQPGRVWLVSPVSHKVIDVIATGAGTLQVQVASMPGSRVNP
jgi:hypothetical protein